MIGRARTSLLAVATAIVLLAGAASPVGAVSTASMCVNAWTTFASKPSVATAQTVGRCEIDRRIADLTTLETAADQATALTSTNRATIDRTISRTTSGLRGLRSQIGKDATVASVGPDLETIISDYRVYVLVVRQSWLAAAADSELAAVKVFETTNAQLTTAIDTANRLGYDTTTAESARTAMASDVAAARKLVAGLPARVLALTPAQYNAGSAEPIMNVAAKHLAEALALLQDARIEARAAVTALEGL